MSRHAIDEVARVLGKTPTSRRRMLIAAAGALGFGHQESLASSRKRKDKSCPFLTKQCGNKCVKLLSDRKNCGYCGLKCSSGERCHMGHCEEICVPETCQSRNYECDIIGTGCGKTLSCGNCPTGLSCRHGQCVVVPPDPPLYPGQPCGSLSTCVQTYGPAYCGNNYFYGDGPQNCCLSSGGQCSSSRHCCGWSICVGGKCTDF